MPIYEYDCQKCGDRSEELQGLSSPVLTVCKLCGGALKKMISAPAFQFKGTGWYVTDYARKGDSSGSADSESGNGSDSSDSSSAKLVDSGESTTARGNGQKKDSPSDGQKAANSKATSKKVAKESSA